MTIPPGHEQFWADYQKVLHRFYTAGMSELDWNQWYEERLGTVLRHVTSRSPFYRRHLEGVNIAEVTPETLHTLPFTTKDDLRREMYSVLSGTPAEASIFYETTGTTGASTPCPRGVRDILTSNASVQESWRRLFKERQLGPGRIGMQIGIVVGNVQATQKYDKLDGSKLLLVQPLGLDALPRGGPVLAIDGVQAGIGDRVLLVQDGKAAQQVLGRGQAAVDAAVVGVIDALELMEA